MGKAAIAKKVGQSKEPHHYVYARLAPSPISGVGVFAIQSIKKGTDIFPDIYEDIIWIDKASVKRLHNEIRRLYDDYCVHKNSDYGCPDSFNKINVSWY